MNVAHLKLNGELQNLLKKDFPFLDLEKITEEEFSGNRCIKCDRLQITQSIMQRLGNIEIFKHAPGYIDKIKKFPIRRYSDYSLKKEVLERTVYYYIKYKDGNPLNRDPMNCIVLCDRCSSSYSPVYYKPPKPYGLYQNPLFSRI